MRISAGTVALRTWTFLVAAFMVIPTLVIVPMAFTESSRLSWPPRGFQMGWFQMLLTDPEWRAATATSVSVALWTALAATLLGALLSLTLVRGSFAGQRTLNVLMMSPMIVPVVIVGVGCYFAYVRLGIAGTTLGLVAAHTALALPLSVVSISTSLRTIDPDLERAAAGLGARPVTVFRRITLPQLASGLAASAIFAFITSWDDVVVAGFITSPTVRTLPVVIFNQLRTGLDPTVAAAATLLMLVTTVALLALGIGSFLRTRRRT
ncbi:ABC transporter permease [Actinomadura verrucosospora]|uniref:ABC transporter permease n=1 Tax=Actinomadura verrucosospora TaxID=46165 RepID=UPI0031E5114F